MANTIITKNSSAGANVPAAGELVEGELAINVTDKILYSKTASAVFQVFDGVYAPVASPTFTGTITAGNMTVNGSVFDITSNTYYDWKGASVTAGGHRFYNDSGTLQCYVYWNNTNYGLLYGAGSTWSIKCNVADNGVELPGNVTVGGTLGVTGAITGPNVSTGSDPGHTHTTASITGLSGTNTGDNAVNTLYSGLVTDTGEPATLASGGTPTLSAGITAGEMQTLLVVDPAGTDNSDNNAVNTLYSSLVTNATHTSEVTGATALTMAAVAISNKTLVTAVATDMVLLWDATDSALKRANVSDFLGGSGTVTSVSAGNGMDFTTITSTGAVTMGTPGSVTDTSTNSVSASSHTHAVSHTGTGNFVMASSPSIASPTITGSAIVSGTSMRFNDNVELYLGTSSDFGMRFNATNAEFFSNVGSFDLLMTDVDLDMNDNDIIQPVIVDYAIESSTQNVSGTTATLTYANGPAFECDMEAATGNVTITLSGGPPSGTYGEIIVKVIQDTTVRTLTWAGFTNLYWPGGTEPAVTATSNAVDIFHFSTWDGGITWWGSAIQDMK